MAPRLLNSPEFPQLFCVGDDGLLWVLSLWGPCLLSGVLFTHSVVQPDRLFVFPTSSPLLCLCGKKKKPSSMLAPSSEPLFSSSSPCLHFVLLQFFPGSHVVSLKLGETQSVFWVFVNEHTLIFSLFILYFFPFLCILGIEREVEAESNSMFVCTNLANKSDSDKN